MVNLFDYKLNPRYSWPIDIFLITEVVALMVGHCWSPYCHDGVSRKSKLLLGIILFCFHVFYYWLILALLSFLNQPTDVRRACIENPMWSIILSGLRVSVIHWRMRIYSQQYTIPTVKKRLGVLMTTLTIQSSRQQISIGYIDISQSINH